MSHLEHILHFKNKVPCLIYKCNEKFKLNEACSDMDWSCADIIRWCKFSTKFTYKSGFNNTLNLVRRYILCFLILKYDNICYKIFNVGNPLNCIVQNHFLIGMLNDRLILWLKINKCLLTQSPPPPFFFLWDKTGWILNHYTHTKHNQTP